MKRLILFIGLASLGSSVWAISCPSGYNYYRTITINHSNVSNLSANLTDFPILFTTNTVTLSTSASGGHLTGSGFDILVTSSDASSAIYFDTDTINNTGSATLSMWIKVPIVSSTTDTTIYLFYGNSGITSYNSKSTATWDSNYVGVWHLGTSSSLSLIDSTFNRNTLTNVGSVSATSGQISGAGSFGSTNYLKVSPANGTSLDFSGNLTMEAWINPTDEVNYRNIMLKAGGSNTCNNRDYSVYLNQNTVDRFFMGFGGNSGTTYVINSITNSSWNDIAITADGSNVISYINGSGTSAVDSAQSTTGTGDFTIGYDAACANYGMLGSIDEVRVSKIARSAAWLTTEYNNTNSPTTFYTLGTETACSAGVIQTNAPFFGTEM